MAHSSAATKHAIPLLDLKAQHAAVRGEIRAAIDEVCESQQFVLGPQGETLERELAAYCDAQHGIALANGTDALTIALAAAGVGPGDEVIIPAFTFVATATAVVRLSAKPVFADILPDTFNLDPEEIERRSTKKTKAVIPVHLYGLPAEMYGIGEHASRFGLTVIEDNAQAIGARYGERRTGSFGLCGCISFYPTKNLGAYGDGGMVVTNYEKFGAHLKQLRDHGQSARYICAEAGWNSRLDEIQAAVLRVKLRHLDDWTLLRQQHAAKYDELLRGLPGIATPTVQEHCEHVYHLYTIRVEGGAARRDLVRQKLAEAGIATGVYYPVPLHLQPVFLGMGHKRGDFPNAERASEEALSLPMFPELREDQIARVAEELRVAV
ncbi:MAG TPA: DegT/DnrJ/EryC1/StrS family aminotransferase [Candidatus Acidoferrales bacterium]|nr:DegT/DnrJ/EryC1/StrS family aminotransferase [Candidatus Acidoferrales bacterium]